MGGVFEVQGVRVDPDARQVWRDGSLVVLSRKEFDLLHALIARAGEVVSREDLMREVWHTTFFTSSKTIDVHLGWVRRKIGDDPRSPHLITTLRGRGLRFELAAPPPRGARPPTVLPLASLPTVAPVASLPTDQPAGH